MSTDTMQVSRRALVTVDPGDARFAVVVTTTGLTRVVHVSGELDLDTRHLVCQACLQGTALAVVVDMTDVTFIDCCGYGALIVARRCLNQLGGSLTVRNQVGQPAHFLDLLARLETGQPHEYPPSASSSQTGSTSSVVGRSPGV